MKLILISVTAIIITAFSFGACIKTAEDTDAIEDTAWVLESFGEQGNLKSVLEDTEITATFESAEGQVKGSAGCNSYFGSYELSNSNLSILQIGNTEMYCLEPEGVMDQEKDYLKLLSTAESHEVIDGKLHITAGTNILIFSVKQ